MGTPATDPDEDWTALLVAPYPEWTSEHNCLDAAHTTRAADVLRRRPDGGGSDDQHPRLNPGGPDVRMFDTFTQPLAELIEARIWAGLHYRSADVAGQALGRNVANYGAANHFQPVGR